MCFKAEGKDQKDALPGPTSTFFARARNDAFEPETVLSCPRMPRQGDRTEAVGRASGELEPKA